MSRPVWLVVSSAVLASVPCARAAPPGAHGRVIRVERPRTARLAPRMCDVRSAAEGICLGAQPQRGEIVTLLDERGRVGEVRIIEVGPFAIGARAPLDGCASLWSIKTDLLSGDLATTDTQRIGVIDPGLDPRRARVIPRDQLPAAPSGRDDDKVMAALDRNGDAVADFLLTGGPCDGAAGGSTGTCLHAWTLDQATLVRVQQLDLSSCGL